MSNNGDSTNRIGNILKITAALGVLCIVLVACHDIFGTDGDIGEVCFADRDCDDRFVCNFFSPASSAAGAGSCQFTDRQFEGGFCRRDVDCDAALVCNSAIGSNDQRRSESCRDLQGSGGACAEDNDCTSALQCVTSLTVDGRLIGRCR